MAPRSAFRLTVDDVYTTLSTSILVAASSSLLRGNTRLFYSPADDSFMLTHNGQEVTVDTSATGRGTVDPFVVEFNRLIGVV